MSFIYRTHTRKSPYQTAGDIMKILLEAGARGVAFFSGGDGEINGIDFQIEMDGKTVPVRIPVNPEQVKIVFEEEGIRTGGPDQYKRTAWRLSYEWVRVQLSYVTMGQADLAEVFMPYILVNGKTVYELATAKGLPKMLGLEKK